ncbi:hypothetical protein ACIRLA_46280 [Streptomyces sp. NPDC102364]|uniref:hypothetical protein n=1 Tax=Streptomyces sp. NPDC102364 TaxID=3366161 RepID=UPI0038175843
MTEPQYRTAWVCTDCTLRLMNMSRTAVGIMRAEHRGENLCGDVDECDCATDPVGRSACEGCGSAPGRARHGMTVFEE